jgi:tRNA pseudouridine55 synthase
VKVAGRRAYALARAGNTALVLPEREIEVYRFEETWREGDRRGFEIECSSGTYVRSLIADLGDAYCEQLRRTAIGPFDSAVADPDLVIPLPSALGFLPELRLDPEQARRAGYGLSVPAGPHAAGSEVVRITGEDGLIALAEPRDGGELKPVVGFSPPL